MRNHPCRFWLSPNLGTQKGTKPTKERHHPQKSIEAVNAWNIQTCEKEHWNNNLAICHLPPGWYEVCRGQLSPAEEALTQAERILRPSGMAQQICRLDWG